MPPTFSTPPDRVLSKLDELAAEHAELARQLEDPAIVGDHARARDLAIRKAGLDAVASGYGRYRALRTEAAELREAAAADAEFAELAEAELPRLEADAAAALEAVKATLVQSEDRAVGAVILEVRAGTGGDEAGLWARDLLAMYERYAQSKRWRWEVMDASVDDAVGGVRHAVVGVRGEGVFAELAFEAGVHSVKRVPATETQGRIHTSTATVAVLPEPEAVELKIDWAADVEEHITTAQGPGGQNVNKVATACHLIHKPTGLEVRMQESKSQRANREKARRVLMARLYDLEQAKAAAERGSQRRSQIGTGQRSEKVRVYRYQDDIAADQRLDVKFKTSQLLAGELGPVVAALLDQETTRRLAEL